MAIVRRGEQGIGEENLLCKGQGIVGMHEVAVFVIRHPLVAFRFPPARYHITTADGQNFTAAKLILCPGAWGNDLLAHFDLKLDMQVKRVMCILTHTRQLRAGTKYTNQFPKQSPFCLLVRSFALHRRLTFDVPQERNREMSL